MDDRTRIEQDVDRYLVQHLVDESPAHAAIRAAADEAGLPSIEVSAPAAKLLTILCRMVGARRALEFGTLAGYSTVALAEGVDEGGHVTTLEIDPRHAEVARESFRQNGVADRVEVIVGPAIESARALIADGAEPFDLIFIDADKRQNIDYLDASIALARSGTVIVVDNVVRAGQILDVESADPSVIGSRAVVERIGADPRLEATALQTVGAKGWDGFALALVR